MAQADSIHHAQDAFAKRRGPYMGIAVHMLTKLWAAFRNMCSECRASFKLGSDTRSRLRLTVDFSLSRLLPFLPRSMLNGEREIAIRNGIRIRYRLNRGDLQGIREVWFDKAYCLPFPISNRVFVDLGANIGLTSVWMTKMYRFSRLIAVEPDPQNAALLRRNCEINGINAELLEAAVGAVDGIGKFQRAALSNLGRLSDEGNLVVPVVSMRYIIERFGLSEIDLVKLDIEGGEQDLLMGPREWLLQTRAIIAEFHPGVVDYPLLTQILEEQGFHYFRANTAFPNNMDSFCRATA